MNPEQALQFLQTVCDQGLLTKQGHVNVQAAATVIQQALAKKKEPPGREPPEAPAESEGV